MNADSSARRGIFVAPFDELSEPRARGRPRRARGGRGWDGFFVWDHVAYRAPCRPWPIRGYPRRRGDGHRAGQIGPLVTPLVRAGAAQAGARDGHARPAERGPPGVRVGLGSDRHGEFDPARFGEEGDPRARAVLLDEGLERLPATGRASSSRVRSSGRASRSGWRPAGQTGARWRRAARWDGLFPIDLPGPEALAELAAEVRPREPATTWSSTNPAGTDPAPWVAAGATWCLTGFGPQPTRPRSARRSTPVRQPASVSAAARAASSTSSSTAAFGWSTVVAATTRQRRPGRRRR